MQGNSDTSRSASGRVPRSQEEAEKLCRSKWYDASVKLEEEIEDVEDFPKTLKDAQIDRLTQQEEEDAAMDEEKKGVKSKAAEGAEGSPKKKKTKTGGEIPEEDQLTQGMAGPHPKSRLVDCGGSGDCAWKYILRSSSWTIP